MIIKLHNKSKVNMIFEMWFKIKIKFHISNEYQKIDNLKETFKANIIFMTEYISRIFDDYDLF
jgi:hypothetical protein